MTGTLVNAGGIVLGALIGVLLRRGIPERINSAVLKANGLAIVVIALNGILPTMLRADPGTGKISDQGGLLLLVSLVVGCVAGELLRIEDRLTRFGEFVEKRSGAEGFARGFVTASLVFTIGAMSIVGPINDGLTGDSSILFVKTTLDFTTSIILASALGFGVAFAAAPVLVLQGCISLMAGWLSAYVTDDLLALFCMVGYAIVLAIGFNFLIDAKIKTANLLPALAVPVIYYFIRL